MDKEKMESLIRRAIQSPCSAQPLLQLVSEVRALMWELEQAQTREEKIIQRLKHWVGGDSSKHTINDIIDALDAWDKLGEEEEENVRKNNHCR